MAQQNIEISYSSKSQTFSCDEVGGSQKQGLAPPEAIPEDTTMSGNQFLDLEHIRPSSEIEDDSEENKKLEKSLRERSVESAETDHFSGPSHDTTDVDAILKNGMTVGLLLHDLSLVANLNLV